MYASIRRYTINPGTEAEITKLVNEEFVPIISKGPGFVAFYVVVAKSDVLVSISIFQDKAGAVESNALALDFVMRRIGSLLPNSPEIIAGEVMVHKIL